MASRPVTDSTGARMPVAIALVGPRPRVLDAVEAAEQAGQLILGDPRPCIRYAQHRLAVLLAQRDGDIAVQGELERVAEQVWCTS